MGLKGMESIPELNYNQTSLHFCYQYLKRVSRSFYLNTMRLDSPYQEIVTISYLLCRIADTIEDDHKATLEIKSALFDHIESFLDLKPIDLKAWNQYCSHLKCTDAEQELLHNISHVMIIYKTFSPPIHEILQKRIKIMIEGMKKYHGSCQNIRIAHFEGLNLYCYYVAGVIGELLTEVFFQESEILNDSHFQQLFPRAVSFGLALQYTNIIKDFFQDIKRGDLFWPVILFEKYQCDPLNLASSKDRYKILREMAHAALPYLLKGHEYIGHLPKEEKSLRLFCLWPLLFALKTLNEVLERSDSFFSGEDIKISRQSVKKIMTFTSFFHRSQWAMNFIFNRYYQSLMKKLIT